MKIVEQWRDITELKSFIPIDVLWLKNTLKSGVKYTLDTMC